MNNIIEISREKLLSILEKPALPDNSYPETIILSVDEFEKKYKIISGHFRVSSDFQRFKRHIEKKGYKVELN